MAENVRSSLLVCSRQRASKVNVRLLRWMTRHLLQDLLHRDHYDLCVTLVADDRMTRLNQEHLRHQGTTDVITFDYNDPSRAEWIVGEIFISVEEACRQARRFRTEWTSEIARYVVHGILHLAGYDDQTPPDRKRMKRQEDTLLAKLDEKFNTAKLAGAAARPARHRSHA